MSGNVAIEKMEVESESDALTEASRLQAHPLRYQVLEAIDRSPCSTKGTIAEGLGVPVRAVEFHVRALTTFGAVEPCGGGLTADMDTVRTALDDDLGEGERAA